MKGAGPSPAVFGVECCQVSGGPGFGFYRLAGKWKQQEEVSPDGMPVQRN